MATGFTYISDGGRVVEIHIDRRELAALVEHGYIGIGAGSQLEGPLQALVVEVVPDGHSPRLVNAAKSYDKRWH